MSKPITKKRTKTASSRVLSAPAPIPAASTSTAEITYSLEDNLNRTGPSSDTEVAAFVEGHSNEELVKEGADVDTSRIDTDAARLHGIALDYWNRATPEERTKVRGVSSTLLRASVWSAWQGHVAYLSLVTGLNNTRSARYAHEEGSGSLRARGRNARVQLAESLKMVAAGDRSLSSRIDDAANQSSSPEGLAGALKSLASVGREMLKKPSAAMKLRLADGESGVTTSWLDECDDLAEQVRRAGIVADSALPSPEVTRAQVDRWDGINLLLLRRLVRLFEAAHSVDPAVPRLVPIALRSLFGYRKPKEQPPVAATPAAPLASPAPAR